MDKILINWSHGFLWFHLSKHLLEKWDEIIWVNRLSSFKTEQEISIDSHMKPVREQLLKNFAHYSSFGLSPWDKDGFYHLLQDTPIETFIHMAGNSNVRNFIEDPALKIGQELDLFITTIDACRQHWVKKFVYASSTFTNFADDESCNVLNPYTAANKAKEIVARSYDTYYGLQTIWLRLPGVYWPYSRENTIINIFLSKLMNNQPVDIYWDPDVKISLIEADVLSHRLRTLLLSNEKASGIYCINPTHMVSVNDIIRLITQTTGKSISTNYYPMTNLYSVHPAMNIQNNRYKPIGLDTSNIEDSLIQTIQRNLDIAKGTSI